MSEINYPTVTTIYPFGTSGSIAPPGDQNGTAGPVPADGSALFPVVFPGAFISGVTNIQTTIVANSRIGTDELTLQISSITLTGFNIYVAGGEPGSTVSVFWSAQGT